MDHVSGIALETRHRRGLAGDLPPARVMAATNGRASTTAMPRCSLTVMRQLQLERSLNQVQLERRASRPCSSVPSLSVRARSNAAHVRIDEVQWPKCHIPLGSLLSDELRVAGRAGRHAVRSHRIALIPQPSYASRALARGCRATREHDLAERSHHSSSTHERRRSPPVGRCGIVGSTSPDRERQPNLRACGESAHQSSTTTPVMVRPFTNTWPRWRSTR